ncbi:hypothetical protein [Lentzea sp. CC55]|uniref:hypothetical protein n=1 Tax=Lentzea sp. CC55 TaxID=2884909 RepID=UPI001F309938|nr:hypothetical protein [Lentzea sp. CC55]MCG8926129.1 hypothetical protein [Lentzea sp. CC55]
MGFAFPADYKETPVGGAVFDHVVSVISPIADEDSLDDFTTDVHAAPEGLVPRGTAAEGGCTPHWRADGPPGRWTITLCDSEFSEQEDHDGPVSAFLHDLLTGEVVSGLVAVTPARKPALWPVTPISRDTAQQVASNPASASCSAWSAVSL